MHRATQPFEKLLNNASYRNYLPRKNRRAMGGENAKAHTNGVALLFSIARPLQQPVTQLEKFAVRLAAAVKLPAIGRDLHTGSSNSAPPASIDGSSPMRPVRRKE
jgi:hypothetical protein